MTAKGEALRSGLKAAFADNPHVQEVRGVGLITGIQLDQPATKLVELARDKGVLVITAGKGDIVRLVPPLVVEDEEIKKCCQVLAEVAKEALV